MDSELRSAAASPDVERDAVEVDGEQRGFSVLGARRGPASRALVLVFHGSKQSAEVHRRFTGDALAPLAADDGAVLAYLDGYRGNWNDARRQSAFPARLRGVDDIAFTRAVIDRLASSHGIDPRRVVAIGYSNGGQMVLRLLHQTPGLLAAAIVVAAAMPAPEDLLPVVPEGPVRPVPITLVHGTRDRIAPFAGGSTNRLARALFKVGGRTSSAPETAAHLARRNGITAAPTTEPVPTAAGARSRVAVVETAYRQEGLPPVILYEVRGGGHTIPGAHPSPRFLGRTASAPTLLELAAAAVDATGRQRDAGAEAT